MDGVFSTVVCFSIQTYNADLWPVFSDDTALCDWCITDLWTVEYFVQCYNERQ